MKIEIIGAGAVGLLIASYLSEQNADVHLVKRQQQVSPHTISRLNTDTTITKDLAVTMSTGISGVADLVIIAVKYGQLQSIYEQLQHINDQIPILFVQNGLAHYEEALQLPQRHIAFSSIQFGAQKLTDFHVAHKGVGVTKIAVARGDKQKFTVLENYSTANFPIVFQPNAEEMLLEKALLNCFINPLTAILQVKNGQLIAENKAFQLLKNLYNEIIAVFPQYEKIIQFEQIVALCERTADNTSSMLADRLAKRLTEADTIVLPFLTRAAQQNQQLPILNTLYLLVKAFEESGEKM